MTAGDFQVKKSVRRQLEKRKRRIRRRVGGGRVRKPTKCATFGRGSTRFEVADRARATNHGGLPVVHQLVVRSGLANEIDSRLKLLKVHKPYHESDHVLNIAYNALCGGRVLDDLELRRHDESFLDALGVSTIPAPTTAGDFCRRFAAEDVKSLMDAINVTRLRIWSRQEPEFTQDTARIDLDGSIVATTGNCKQGMGLAYNGTWGYKPLIVSLANTAEPLFIVNRSGNRRASEGAAAYLDKAIALCREAGFEDVLLRGDNEFSQTTELDRWDADGVRFVFGFRLRRDIKSTAESLPDSEFSQLIRAAKAAFDGVERAKQAQVKQQIVREKGYKNIRLQSEDVAEFDYQPMACERAYRMVVLRKNLTVERGEQALIDDVRYFLYITNDRDLAASDVVREANQRCDQENLIAQLKSGVRALHAPVNTMVANWAYMVMASLAWTLKAWTALSLTIHPRWRKKHEANRRDVLRMDFRTFCSDMIAIPAQVLTSARTRIVRFLAWRPRLPILFRLLDAL